MDAIQVLVTGEYKMFERNDLQNGRMNRFQIKERCVQCDHHCMYHFNGSITLAFGLNNTLKSGQSSFLHQNPTELVINLKEIVQKIFKSRLSSVLNNIFLAFDEKENSIQIKG